MGTWGTGPFDNDTAADFAGDLDDAPPGEREALVRGVLARTVSAAGYLDEAQEAVAAAALISASARAAGRQKRSTAPSSLFRCSLKTSGNWLPGPWTGSWPAGRGLRCGSALLTRPMAGSGRGCAGCTRPSAAFARCPVAWSLSPGGSGPSCLPPTVRRDRNRPQRGRFARTKPQTQPLTAVRTLTNEATLPSI